ncbi:putative short-chain dehydrogenase reductase [Erysiphe necator]|uniref:Putative short-chain dehydrogenase reductase n=1 Tax=Uncinula necator TaxID=52586 RepID=A0A0B1P0P4_UNCNE|nr:putative short-chain dehydrogenase reductase [Erysiphe necator]
MKNSHLFREVGLSIYADESTISRAAEEAKSMFQSPTANPLHLAFCMPGILHPEKSPSQMNHTDLIETFAINSIGPMLVFKHFSPFLPGKKNTPFQSQTDSSLLPTQAIWLNMSARVGSISDNNLGGWYSYRASKAAVNSFTKSFDLYLQTRTGGNAMAISYHPGTVKTDLSKEYWAGVPKEKLFSPEFAVAKMWEVIKGLDLSSRGKCFDWKADVILP